MIRILGSLGFSLFLSLTATAGDYVFLNSILKDGNEVRITYGKNFDTCVHLLNSQKQIVHVQNHFCETGLNTTSVRTQSDFNVAIRAGQSYQLCHGNNYGVCSPLVPVQGMPTSPFAGAVPYVPDYDDSWLGPIPSIIDVYSSWGPYRQAARYQAYLNAQAAALARIEASYGGLFGNLEAQSLAYDMPVRSVANLGTGWGGGSCQVSVRGGGTLRAITCERYYSSWLQTLPVGTAMACYNTCLSQVNE